MYVWLLHEYQKNVVACSFSSLSHPRGLQFKVGGANDFNNKNVFVVYAVDERSNDCHDTKERITMMGSCLLVFGVLNELPFGSTWVCAIRLREILQCEHILRWPKC